MVFPWISTFAHEFSWYPKENPTFLKPAAKPRPRTSVGLPRRWGRFLPGAPAEFVGRSLNDLRHAHGPRRRSAHGQREAVAKRIAQPELNRIEPKLLGQLVHLALGHEEGLRSAKAAKGRAWQVVGVDAVDVGLHVGNEIGPVDVMAAFPSTLLEVYMYAPASPMISFSAATSFPSLGGGPTRAQDNGVALAVPDDRLAPAPDDLDRLAKAQHGQSQDDLNGEILASAEGTTDGRIDDPNSVLGQVQARGQWICGRHPSTARRRQW